MQHGGPAISAVTIPAGLGGTYRVGIEALTPSPPWWLSALDPPYDPQQAAYVPGNVDTMGEVVVWDGPNDVTVEIRVNGAVVAGDTYSNPNPGAPCIPRWHIDATIDVVAGDEVSVSIRTANTWSVFNAFGQFYLADPPGVFFLTFLRGKGGKQFLRGHVTYAAEMAGGR
jgi:hypothetical protein